MFGPRQRTVKWILWGLRSAAGKAGRDASSSRSEGPRRQPATVVDKTADDGREDASQLEQVVNVKNYCCPS